MAGRGFFDRLIARAEAEQIVYAKVVFVDEKNKRVKVAAQGRGTVWASYTPQDFPSIAVDSPVAVGTSAGGSFVVRQLSTMIPETSTILIV